MQLDGLGSCACERKVIGSSPGRSLVQSGVDRVLSLLGS